MYSTSQQNTVEPIIILQASRQVITAILLWYAHKFDVILYVCKKDWDARSS